jgi:hypothetical protein
VRSGAGRAPAEYRSPLHRSEQSSRQSR